MALFHVAPSLGSRKGAHRGRSHNLLRAADRRS
jgi:hypothetical protein